MAARTFREREKKNNKFVSFSTFFFNVYAHVDNRERARETNVVGRKI